MITFSELAVGNKFKYKGTDCIKIEQEVFCLESPTQGTGIRVNVDSTESSMKALGKVVVVFNAVNIDNGGLYSLQSDAMVEPINEFSSENIQNYWPEEANDKEKQVSDNQDNTF